MQGLGLAAEAGGAEPGALGQVGETEAALAGRGVAARVQVVYRTAPAGLASFPVNVDAVLIHSPKAGRRLAEAPELRAAAPSMVAICISAAAAEPLHGLGFRELLVSPAPNETALLQRLDAWVLTQKPVRFFPPAFWIAIAFALVCIVAAILVTSLGPRLFPLPVKSRAAATAQPLQIPGKSG